MSITNIENINEQADSVTVKIHYTDHIPLMRYYIVQVSNEILEDLCSNASLLGITKILNERRKEIKFLSGSSDFTHIIDLREEVKLYIDNGISFVELLRTA